MFSIAPAIANVTEDKRIYAYDSRRRDGSLGKAFLCMTDDEFKQVLMSGSYGWHFYEVLLPTRPTRIFVDIETENGVYENVKKGAESFINMLKTWCDTMGIVENTFLLLDSSSEKKTSFHIVGGPYLKNPYHVGALVRRVTCYVHCVRETKEVEFLFDNDGKYVVDECVYTQNRQFRLAEMCKLGSQRFLKGCTWHESLLQNTNVSSVTCLEIDDSEPLSTSRKAVNMFSMVDGKWFGVNTGYSQNVSFASSVPSTLANVVRNVDANLPDGHLTSVQFSVNTGCYTISCTSKSCRIANRIHRGNHIWFVLDPWKRTVVQKCFDDACRRSEFPLVVCDNLWESWIRLTREMVDINSSE